MDVLPMISFRVGETEQPFLEHQWPLFVQPCRPLSGL